MAGALRGTCTPLFLSSISGRLCGFYKLNILQWTEACACLWEWCWVTLNLFSLRGPQYCFPVTAVVVTLSPAVHEIPFSLGLADICCLLCIWDFVSFEVVLFCLQYWGFNQGPLTYLANTRLPLALFLALLNFYLRESISLPRLASNWCCPVLPLHFILVKLLSSNYSPWQWPWTWIFLPQPPWHLEWQTGLCHWRNIWVLCPLLAWLSCLIAGELQGFLLDALSSWDV